MFRATLSVYSHIRGPVFESGLCDPLPTNEDSMELIHHQRVMCKITETKDKLKCRFMNNCTLITDKDLSDDIHVCLSFEANTNNRAFFRLNKFKNSVKRSLFDGGEQITLKSFEVGKESFSDRELFYRHPIVRDLLLRQITKE